MVYPLVTFGAFLFVALLLPRSAVTKSLLLLLLLISPYLQEGIPGLGYLGEHVGAAGKIHLTTWAYIGAFVGWFMRYRQERLLLARVGVQGTVLATSALALTLLTVGVSGLAPILDNFLAPFLGLLVVCAAAGNEEELRSSRRLVMIMVALHASMSIVERAIHFNFMNGIWAGQPWYDLDISQRFGIGYRSTGLWGHPLHGSVVVILAAWVGLAQTPSTIRRFLILVAALSVPAVTGSRLAFLGVLAIMAPFVLLQALKQYAPQVRLLGALVIGITAGAIGWLLSLGGLFDTLLARGFDFQEDVSAGIRVASWQLLAQIPIKEHLFGSGLGASQLVAQQWGFSSGMENPYLGLVLTIGILPLVLVLTALVSFSVWLLRRRRDLLAWCYVASFWLLASAYNSFAAKTTLVSFFVLFGYLLPSEYRSYDQNIPPISGASS